jgi:hypothetical protein
MDVVIYILCALTCAASCALLTRGYLQKGHRLLFWSALCFGGLTVSNVLLIFDKVVLPDVDLSAIRLSIALLSLLVMLFGLIWEE